MVDDYLRTRFASAMFTRGSIHLHLFVLSSTLFLHVAIVSSWSPISELLLKHSAAVQKLLHHPAICMMPAGTSDDVGHANGSLLLSNIQKIGLVADESSKVRLLLASQSPRRREILVSFYDVYQLCCTIFSSNYVYRHANVPCR